MPRALSHYARDLVAAKLDSGMSLAAIHNDTNVSSRQIRRIRHNIQTWGSIVPPSLVKRGRPKILTLTMEDALAEYLDQRPTAYQNEM
ncbi:MAG: hypothetical protein M1830_005139, partial [Pleopsidium flavum]